MGAQQTVTERDGTRYTDVSKEPDKPLPPIDSFTNERVPTLRDAVKTLHKLIDDLEYHVELSINKCKHPKDDLSQDESAALYLYSLQWPKEKDSFYTLFNRALRHENRLQLVPFRRYLHLFMHTLKKLPSIQERVWRGVNGNLAEQYKTDSVHVWWGASSCSDMLHVTQSFLDGNKDRTLFSIKCYEGKVIKNHSAFPNESEIVLPPGTCLRVKSLSNLAPKVHVIDLEQIPYEEPKPDNALSTTSSNDDHHVYLLWLDASVNKSKENIKALEELQKLSCKVKIFEEPDRCGSFIDQNTDKGRVILIVGGQIGREFVPKIQDRPQLVAVFVFCMNKVENEKWAKNYAKIKAVIVRHDELIQQVSLFAYSPVTPMKVCYVIEGYRDMPLVSLEEAVKPLIGLIPDLERYVGIAKSNIKDDNGPLTADEAASIMLYTMQWPQADYSLWHVLNRTLRSADRTALKPWFRYFKLILTGLYKLPSFKGTVWRGVRGDFRNDFEKGMRNTWWGFSATTMDMEVLESELMVDQNGNRTIFSIQCQNGKDIREYSLYPKEEEILLMPGFYFEVLSQANWGNGLCMINIRETQPDYPIIEPPF